MTIDLHGKTTMEAVGTVGRALANAGSGVYQLRLIHGYNRGTKIRDIIYEWYRYDPKVKRILPGDNPGITILVLREL